MYVFDNYQLLDPDEYTADGGCLYLRQCDCWREPQDPYHKICWAIDRKNHCKVQELVPRNPEWVDRPPRRDFPSLIQRAIMSEADGAMVRTVLSEHPKPYLDGDGRTPLHVTMVEYRCECDVSHVPGKFEYLLAEFADSLNTFDNGGYLPLHHACEYRLSNMDCHAYSCYHYYVRRLWNLHGPSLMILTKKYESPLHLVVNHAFVWAAADTSLMEEMLHDWPVASCIVAGTAPNMKFPWQDYYVHWRRRNPHFVLRSSRVFLQVFASTVELVLDETSTCSSDVQMMLRETLADLLVGHVVSSGGAGALTRESILTADATRLVVWILTVKWSARRQRSNRWMTQRIMDDAFDRGELYPWFHLLRTDQAFVEFVHAWYEVNRAGRLDILLRSNTTKMEQDAESDRTVLLAMLEAATSRSVSGTFLLLREMPSSYETFFPRREPCAPDPTIQPSATNAPTHVDESVRSSRTRTMRQVVAERFVRSRHVCCFVDSSDDKRRVTHLAITRLDSREHQRWSNSGIAE